MSVTLIRYTCPVCGDILSPQGEGAFKCRSCGSIWEKERIDDYNKILEKFDAALREQRQEDLAKLARRRYEEVKKKYVSNIELAKICNDILNLNPDDVYSQFFLATCKEEYELVDFLSKFDIEKYYPAIGFMLDYLIPALKARWINAVGGFIERAYKKNDIAKFNHYRTRFDEMAESVEEGIFEPGIPRDIFIAYSSQDMAEVNKLLRVLEDENELSCFMAARNLRHGSGAVENYQEAINTALESCKAVVFVSSQNSRTLKCEAMKELAYIKKNLPNMWRIEFLVKDYRGTSVEKVCKEFFADLEYCTSPQQVADRYTEKYMLAEEGGETKKAVDIEEEIQRRLAEERQKEAERAAKEKAEAESKRKFEEETRRKLEAEYAAKLQAEAEAKRKAEAEAEAKRKFEEETRRKLEAEYAAKFQSEAEAKRKAEAEAEAEAKRKAEAEVKRKAAAEAEAKRKAEAEAEAKRKAAAEAEAKRQAEAKRTANAPAASPLTDFEINNGVLKKYKGNAENVVIPSSITSIAADAFSYCDITSVTIPSSVKSIGDWAFLGCSGLTSITVPSSVTSIGEQAFSECSSLTSIEILGNITSIGDGAFADCGSLASIRIPSSVTRIGESAFLGCGKLTNITIPAGVTSIGKWSFNECSGLTSIEIPSGVTSIGDSAFDGCTALTSINCRAASKPAGWGSNWNKNCNAKVVWGYKDAANTEAARKAELEAKYKAYEEARRKAEAEAKRKAEAEAEAKRKAEAEAEAKRKADAERAQKAYEEARRKAEAEEAAKRQAEAAEAQLQEKAKAASPLSDFVIKNGVLTKYKGNAAAVAIPVNATSIGKKSFTPSIFGTSYLERIFFHDGITSIGNEAFWGCKKLERLDIPGSVATVGACAFSWCDNLASITMESGVTTLDGQAFSGCIGLTKVTLPDTLKEIKFCAFKECKSLGSIVIPASVKTIGWEAFSTCVKLETIYCEAASKPAGWHNDWLKNCPARVVWGYKG